MMNHLISRKYYYLLVLAVLVGCATTAAVHRGPVEKTRLHDGIFNGEYSKFPVKAEVEVQIKNNKILSVNILKHRTCRGKKAEGIIPGRIVQAQSTDVDIVSGATYSSLAIMNAAQRAIDASAENGN